MAQENKNPDIKLAESLLPTFEVTLKHTTEHPIDVLMRYIKRNAVRAYADNKEIKKGKALMHLFKVSEERTVPVISHESLHLTLGHLNEFEASSKLDDVGHGYYSELESSGITQRKLHNLDSLIDELFG